MSPKFIEQLDVSPELQDNNILTSHSLTFYKIFKQPSMKIIVFIISLINTGLWKIFFLYGS